MLTFIRRRVSFIIFHWISPLDYLFGTDNHLRRIYYLYLIGSITRCLIWRLASSKPTILSKVMFSNTFLSIGLNIGSFPAGTVRLTFWIDFLCRFATRRPMAEIPQIMPLTHHTQKLIAFCIIEKIRADMKSPIALPLLAHFRLEGCDLCFFLRPFTIKYITFCQHAAHPVYGRDINHVAL